QAKLHRNGPVLTPKPHDGFMHSNLIAVQEAHELADSAVVLEDLSLVLALVDKLDPDAGVEERELAHALGEYVVIEVDVREDRPVRFEADDRPAFIRRPGVRKRRLRLSQAVFLLVQAPTAVDRQQQV